MGQTNQRQIVKRICALLLCAVLFIGDAGRTELPVWAVQQSAAVTYTTNNQTEEAFRFSIENGAFYVWNIPSAGGYRYVWVKIENGEEAIFPAASVEAVTLPKQDGVYYIEIYLGKERYGAYYGAIYGKSLGIELKNGVASFLKSPVYENNRKQYEAGSTSDTALGYYTQPSHWVESDAAEIKALAKQIADPGDSDFEKVKKVHDWVAENIWYDWDSFLSGGSAEVDALKVLKLKRTVCSGYANVTAALLRAMGIPTKVTGGYALGYGSGGSWTAALISGNETNHAWNEAYADGRWIILDATWDSGNKYERGKFSSGTGLESRKYFDPTLEFFSMDHKMVPEGEYDRWEREQAFSAALSVSKTDLTLKKGKTKQLAVKTSESYISLKDAKITYTSGNAKVATVSSRGKIQAKKAGKTVITTKVKLEGITLKFRTAVTVKN